VKFGTSHSSNFLTNLVLQL